MDSIKKFADELASDMRRAETSLRKVDKTSGVYSYIQRTLHIGYNRAVLVVDSLTSAGILSEPDNDGSRRLR
jgi:DNA segregation ATPase FtsK/SpoIIIE-like protein